MLILGLVGKKDQKIDKNEEPGAAMQWLWWFSR